MIGGAVGAAGQGTQGARGQRVAHGRAEDGFWSRGQFAESELVSWFPVDSAVPACTWERPGGTPTARDARVAAVLRRVLA